MGNETESAYKELQEDYEEAVGQLEDLNGKNGQLQQLYENEVAAGNSNTTRCSTVQQEYTDAMAKIEILMRSNKEYATVESKLNTSEVRVTMLEGVLKKSGEDLDDAKRKNKERQ